MLLVRAPQTSSSFILNYSVRPSTGEYIDTDRQANEGKDRCDWPDIQNLCIVQRKLHSGGAGSQSNRLLKTNVPCSRPNSSLDSSSEDSLSTYMYRQNSTLASATRVYATLLTPTEFSPTMWCRDDLLAWKLWGCAAVERLGDPRVVADKGLVEEWGRMGMNETSATHHRFL